MPSNFKRELKASRKPAFDEKRPHAGAPTPGRGAATARTTAPSDDLLNADNPLPTVTNATRCADAFGSRSKRAGGEEAPPARAQGTNCRSVSVTIGAVTRPQTETVELDADLARRARQEAARRGITLRQLVEDAVERELADEPQQPPFSLIGAFSAGRSDLSELASEGNFEPEPFR